MLNYLEYIKENNELAGYNSFLIYLKIVDKMDIQFLKTSPDKTFNYLNSKSYNLLYISYNIKDIDTLLNYLQFKNSLNLAYDKLKNFKSNNLSFFIGIKQNVIDYGFYNYSNNNIIKIGEFIFNKKILINLQKAKFICLNNIKNDLDINNIINVNILHNIKNDLDKSFFTDKKSKIEIKNTNLITIIFNTNDFEYKNYLDIVEKWKENKKWKDKIDAYFELSDNDLIYYFKIKNITLNDN